MKFDRAYLLFINLSARLFGAMALLVGIFALVCAYAFKEDRWKNLSRKATALGPKAISTVSCEFAYRPGVR